MADRIPTRRDLEELRQQDVARVPTRRDLEELRALDAAPKEQFTDVEDYPVAGAIVRGAVDALPDVGMVVGGAGAGMVTANPAGAMMGAGAGYAAGNQAKQFINKHLLDRPQEPANVMGDMVTGAAGEAGGRLIGKAASEAIPLTKQVARWMAKLKFSPTANEILKEGQGKIAAQAAPAIPATPDKSALLDVELPFKIKQSRNPRVERAVPSDLPVAPASPSASAPLSAVQAGKQSYDDSLQFALDNNIITPAASATTMEAKAAANPNTPDFLNKLLQKQAAKDEALPLLSGQESGALATTAGMSLAMGNPVPALVAVGGIAARRVAKRTVPTTAAYGMNKISQGLEMVVKNYEKLPANHRAALSAAYKRGGQKAVAVTHFMLGQSDPSYQTAQSSEDDE